TDASSAIKLGSPWRYQIDDGELPRLDAAIAPAGVFTDAASRKCGAALVSFSPASTAGVGFASSFKEVEGSGACFPRSGCADWPDGCPEPAGLAGGGEAASLRSVAALTGVAGGEMGS